MNFKYKQKYLKYKHKYLSLKYGMNGIFDNFKSLFGRELHINNEEIQKSNLQKLNVDSGSKYKHIKQLRYEQKYPWSRHAWM
jgi:hypothetical protein